MSDGVWGILGIEPTTDERTIKRAYANKARRCHPEDDAKAFERLNSAYRTAMRYAASREPELEPPGSDAALQEPQRLPERPAYEFETLIVRGMLDYRHRRQRLSGQAMQHLKALYYNPEARRDAGEWRRYLDSAEFGQARYLPEYIAALTGFLRENRDIGRGIRMLFADSYGLWRNDTKRVDGALRDLYDLLREDKRLSPVRGKLWLNRLGIAAGISMPFVAYHILQFASRGPRGTWILPICVVVAFVVLPLAIRRVHRPRLKR